MDDQLIGFIVLAGFLGLLLGIVPLPLVILTRKSKYSRLFRDIGFWLGGIDLLCFLGLALIYYPTNELTGITFSIASGLSFLFLIGIYMTKPPDVGQAGELSKTLKWFLITVLVLTILSIIFIWLRYENNASSKSSTNLASPTPSKTATPPPSASTIAWSTYTNKTFNFSVQYPSNCAVKENNFETISGPLAENHHWPWFEIYHFDSDFYHPSAGTDVYQWLTEESKLTYDEVDPNRDLKIAGLPAIHLKNHQSPQTDASDFYFFIKGTQLFGIQIVQVNGQEDWDLYNKFLNSFTFKE